MVYLWGETFLLTEWGAKVFPQQCRATHSWRNDVLSISSACSWILSVSPQITSCCPSRTKVAGSRMQQYSLSRSIGVRSLKQPITCLRSFNHFNSVLGWFLLWEFWLTEIQVFSCKFIFITHSHSSSSLPAATKEKAKAIKIKKKWIQKQKLQSWWSPDCCYSNSHDPTQRLGQETKANFNFLLGHRGFEVEFMAAAGCAAAPVRQRSKTLNLLQVRRNYFLYTEHWGDVWSVSVSLLAMRLEHRPVLVLLLTCLRSSIQTVYDPIRHSWRKNLFAHFFLNVLSN